MSTPPDKVRTVEERGGLHAKVVRDEGEEPVRGVQELGRRPRVRLDHLLHLRQDLVGAPDLLLAQLAERHLGQVDLEMVRKIQIVFLVILDLGLMIYDNSRCYLLRGLTFNEQEALGENAKNSASTIFTYKII